MQHARWNLFPPDCLGLAARSADLRVLQATTVLQRFISVRSLFEKSSTTRYLRTLIEVAPTPARNRVEVLRLCCSCNEDALRKGLWTS